MAEIENIILEHLKAIQAEIKSLKNGQNDLKAEILSIKSYLHNMQGDALRREQTIAEVQVNLDRINTRLNLTDA